MTIWQLIALIWFVSAMAAAVFLVGMLSSWARIRYAEAARAAALMAVDFFRGLR